MDHCLFGANSNSVQYNPPPGCLFPSTTTYCPFCTSATRYSAPGCKRSSGFVITSRSCPLLVGLYTTISPGLNGQVCILKTFQSMEFYVVQETVSVTPQPR